MSRAAARTAAAVVGVALALVASGCTSDASDGSAPRRTTTTSRAGQTPQDAVANSKLSQLPAYRDVPWADDLKAEQDRFDHADLDRASPYGDFSTPNFTGRYTNVANSERRTLPSSCQGCPRRVVWLLGASSAFGLGQRDDYTTASYLVRQGDAAGLHLVVRNLAAPGHTFVDEIQGLEAHLRVDEVKPDLVVFFDGFNDALSSYMYARVRDGDLLDPIRFGDGWVDEFLANPSAASGLSAAQIEKVAVHVADHYRAASAKVRRDLDARGIKSAFFLQPDGFASPLQSAGLAKSLNVTMRYVASDSDFSRLLRRLQVLLRGDVVDLRAPIATFDEPVFADTTHFNETGARFLAAKMYPVIAKDLP